MSAISSVGGFSSQSVGQRPPQMTKAMKEKMFKEMDADGSGTVSKEEFSAFDTKMKANAPARSENSASSSSREDLMNQLFSTGDTDGDGELNASELDKAMQSMASSMHGPQGMGGMPPPPPENSDSTDSLNGTGTTSSTTSTAETLLSQLFEKSDTDSDGTLSESEFSSLLESIKKQMNSSAASSSYGYNWGGGNNNGTGQASNLFESLVSSLSVSA